MENSLATIRDKKRIPFVVRALTIGARFCEEFSYARSFPCEKGGGGVAFLEGTAFSKTHTRLQLFENNVLHSVRNIGDEDVSVYQTPEVSESIPDTKIEWVNNKIDKKLG